MILSQVVHRHLVDVSALATEVGLVDELLLLFFHLLTESHILAALHVGVVRRVRIVDDIVLIVLHFCCLQN